MQKLPVKVTHNGLTYYFNPVTAYNLNIMSGQAITKDELFDLFDEETTGHESMMEEFSKINWD